ncbi:hypothetical protein [Parasitella parasitica]|uniref:RGS domain-containing protein n=1 Tax=Parasitella parasitica TaxID=35722 RepID=A0A0B7NQ59_9FUNG|nr:hypothetical protein [Parasitella parasitica]
MTADVIISKNNETLKRGSTILSKNTLSSFECREYGRLHQVLSSPEQLAFFESYLQNIHAHENLLFIEALSELRHESSHSHIEHIVNRIWKTFLAENAPLELNVANKQAIADKIKSHRWGIFTKRDALDMFKEAESENDKVIEFDQVYQPSTKTSCCDLEDSKCQKKVVIIGGGFTGFTVASILDPMPRFHVTLVDVKDSFEYTPGMIKLLVRPEETSSLRVRHDAYVKQGRVVIGYADQIVDDATKVKVNDEHIPFDYLVIATGSTYHSKLKSFDTSSLYRLSELAGEHQQLKQARSILIIGGGLVGCELASEIANHTFGAPYDHKKKITLVECNDTLMKRSSVKRQQNATAYLKSLGVQVVLNEKIVDFDSAENNAYLGSTGARYADYDKVFVATGPSPCSQIIRGDGDVGFESCLDHWGRIRVRPTLQLDHWKYDHIFCGGDVTNVQEEKTGYAATLAGVCITRNICRMEKGKAPLKQGSKGTLPSPNKPLHGIESRGGVGRQHLNAFKKTFSFLNPTWAALKYFDESEFLKLVQGEARQATSSAIGRKPGVLALDKNNHLLCIDRVVNHQRHQQQQTAKKTTSLAPSMHSQALSTLSTVEMLPLEISATNLSGSDVISTQQHANTGSGNSRAFPPPAFSSLPKGSSCCACSLQTNLLAPPHQQTYLLPRPRSSQEIRLMDTKKQSYHRKMSSQ